MPDVDAWGAQEWASLGTILAPIVGLLGVIPVLYPDLFRRKNRSRRGEGDYLGLTWVHGEESRRRLRSQRDYRLLRSLVLLGVSFGIYAVLGDYSGIPVISDVASLASMTIFITLAVVVICLVIHIMVRSGAIYRGMDGGERLATIVWYFGVVLITYILVEFAALGFGTLVFAWQHWVIQDGSAKAPWDYIVGFWFSVLTVSLLLVGTSLAMRVTAGRSAQNARLARQYIDDYRHRPSLPARSGSASHENRSDQQNER